jgi:flagellar motor component MotA
VQQFIGLSVGLVIVGLAACLLGGSLLPLLEVAAVIWAVGAFMRGLSGPH